MSLNAPVIALVAYPSASLIDGGNFRHAIKRGEIWLPRVVHAVVEWFHSRQSPIK